MKSENDMAHDTSTLHSDLAKVPAVTLGFWLIKILATTLGETGDGSSPRRAAIRSA